MFGLCRPKFTEDEKIYFARMGFSVKESEITKEYETTPQTFQAERVIKANIEKTRKGYKVTCFVEISYWDDPSHGRGGGSFERTKKIKDFVVLEKIENVVELLKIKKMIE